MATQSRYQPVSPKKLQYFKKRGLWSTDQFKFTIHETQNYEGTQVYLLLQRYWIYKDMERLGEYHNESEYRVGYNGRLHGRSIPPLRRFIHRKIYMP